MFSNTYQSGYYLEVWDSRVNPDKNLMYKQLFKKIPTSMKNFYDKEVKSFIYELQGNQKIAFPFDDRQQLSLHQRYLVLQIFIPIGAQWSIELAINDISNNKKRINITTNSGKQQLKYFSFRYPLENGALQKGIWSFLAIDVYSFCNAFKNTVFRSLDNILLYSSCKIRRIFTMKEWIQFQIPKNYWLGNNIPQTMQMIEFKEIKQQVYNNSLLNSSVQYTKLAESKVLQNYPSGLRNSQKTSPLQQKSNLKGLKLPYVGITNRVKQSTALKSSKLSEKLQLVKSDQGGIGRSNRSLTKADIIIQKSKLRLNSLQQKQQQILNRLKSQDNRFSQKIGIKSKAKINKNENIFKSDLFKSQFSQSGQHNKLVSHSKGIKVKKKFQQDNIFREQSYSSSFSRLSYNNEELKDKSNNISKSDIKKDKKSNNHNKFEQNEISTILGEGNLENEYSFQRQIVVQRKQKGQKQQKGFSKQAIHDSKVSKKTLKQREQIIEEDVWTQDQQQNIIQQMPETPIEEMIQTHQNISRVLVNNSSQGQNNISNASQAKHIISSNKTPNVSENTSIVPANQTIITKQNNKQIIIKQNLNNLQAPNSQLQLIYDEMIGCYYHPQTNTYYEIKK